MSFKLCEETLLAPIAQRVKSFFSEHIKIELSDITNEDCSKDFILYFHTSIIALCGGANGWFLMSFEKNILEEVANKFVYGGIDENEKDEMMFSAADEVANIIIGNVLSNFTINAEETKITPPLGIINAEDISHISQLETLSITFNTKYGKFVVLISADNIKGS